MSEQKNGCSVSIGGAGTLGAIMAACMSWVLNKSVFWLIVHTLIGWPYIIYAFIFKGFKLSMLNYFM